MYIYLLTQAIHVLTFISYVINISTLCVTHIYVLCNKLQNYLIGSLVKMTENQNPMRQICELYCHC